MGGAQTKNGAFPVYYIAGVTDNVTPEDIELAKISWQLLCDDTAPSWSRRKELEGEGSETSHLVWLMDAFYDRLFDVHPSSKALFKGNMKAQGKALIGMLNVAVSVLKSPEKLVPALEDLARRHARYGVIANQYGIVGEVLIWSLGWVLEESFDDRTKAAWFKIYCLMLKFIVPAALAEEERLRSAPTEDETFAMMSRTRAVEQMLSGSSAAQRSPDDPGPTTDPNSNGLGQAPTNSDTVATTASTTTTESTAE